MKLYAFILGTVIAIIGVMSGFITEEFSKTYWICGIAAAAGFIFSGITMGAFVGGMQVRANYFSETKEHNQTRYKLTMVFFLFGLPNIIVVLALFLVQLNTKI
ncbi:MULTISPECIES: DUF5316 domain-containing protein [Heyndrickxia]|uniref:DUF5316 domain-containing protein n=1 Tax=Heyndrickxia TaxID=2837504 RepID=UPI00059F8202|nr:MULTISPECIES: DUF5316 domain-containing protein [Heyndrickxia]MEC2305844.1 DUF5316 domain-containing protein [Weizmannia sp. CD-2023]MEC2342226.1 DUF5316 domain-containing protein [Weizmannia sp. CD-2023]MED4344906.1 DUF5316 domain-containing protein [Heyndrickxia coagulans]RGR87367.1 hypothetical protein DWY22_04930 [Heyndrickxia coagulans]RGR99529.1 hypothetical protein DWY16_05085 [Heyndrickxia coagulans]